MRKIILLSMIAFCTLSYAQSLVVTPLGLRDANDNQKTFVVINMEGKTTIELYENAIKYINKNYKSPNDVIKGKIEGEYLSFITHAEDFIPVKILGRTHYYGAGYTTELNFKDGKVKYEIINLDMKHRTGSPFRFIKDLYAWGIYNKKGEVLNDGAKVQIENYFNSQIKSLSDALNGKNNNDTW